MLAICANMVDDGSSRDLWSFETGSPVSIGLGAEELKVRGICRPWTLTVQRHDGLLELWYLFWL